MDLNKNLKANKTKKQSVQDHWFCFFIMRMSLRRFFRYFKVKTYFSKLTTANKRNHLPSTARSLKGHIQTSRTPEQ